MSAAAQKDDESWHKAKLAARKLKLAREAQARADTVDAKDVEESRAPSPCTVASTMRLGEEAASASAGKAKKQKVPSESPEPEKQKKKKKERKSSSESSGESRRHKRHKVVINIR